MRDKIYWSIINLSRSSPLFRSFIDYIALFFYKTFRPRILFKFKGETYEYFYHPYNRTLASERIVEIPIAKRLVDQYPPDRVLEVGNVLSHYFPVTHDILDKYEQFPGVTNQDIVEFKPLHKYDLIISISTLEHVGKDYSEPNNPKKFLEALSCLKKMLSKKGVLLFTLPVSFNPYVRKLIYAKKIPVTRSYFLKRTSHLNEWKEINFPQLDKASAYDSRYANADYLFIGKLVKK